MAEQLVVKRDDANTRVYLSLNSAGGPIVANKSEVFVQLRDVSWEDMQRLALDYCDEHDALLRGFFLTPSIESLAPNSVSQRSDVFSLKNLESPLAFRAKAKFGQAAPEPFFCNADILITALEAEGIKYAGDRFPRHSHLEAFYDTYEVQRRIGDRILQQRIRDMSWVIPDKAGLHDYTKIASERVIELLGASRSTDELLAAIAQPVTDWLRDPYKKRRSGNRLRQDGSSRPRRPFVLAWFAAWLAERGIWLLPFSAIDRVTEMMPPSWSCFRYGLTLASERASIQSYVERTARVAYPREFADAPTLAETKTRQRVGLERTRAVFMALRWTSTWRSVEQTSTEFFVSYIDAFKERSLRSYQNALSIIVKSALQGCDLDAESMRIELTKIDSKRVRKGDGAAVRAWPWVDDPNYQSFTMKKYYVPGMRAGPNLLSHLAELRALLPNRAKKRVRYWTDAISLWLMYLASLPDSDVPPRLLEIVRERHIDDPRNENALTFNAFLRNRGAKEISEQILTTVHRLLEAFWFDAYDLAKPEARPAQKVCPVLVRFDATKPKGKRKGRTHRRPLDEEIVDFVIAENRRNDFEFSRLRARQNNSQRRMDEVLIRSSDTGEMSRVWFPGTAVLIDVLLNLPFRKKQGRYLDSGEGDEQVVDIETLELRRNPLATAIEGRCESFFKIHPTSLVEHRPVLGMWINTNKTGRPYGVPYIPMHVARNVQRVIDWQQIHNRIREPVSDREYDAVNALVEDRFSVPVFPIFRDPDNPDNTPITDMKLGRYWEDLLEHCEEKFNQATGRNISLFRTVKGKTGTTVRKPIIDIHSLRVTGITMLIENGVPPEIVQQLVGHASIEMTFYYYVLEMRKVHTELMRAIEQRAPRLRDFDRMTPEQLEVFAKRFTRNLTSDPELGRSEFLELARHRNPGWDLRYHGICAGGDCSYGAPPENEGDDGGPLWRLEACSLCRYRITGAPWLVGLVHNVNKLWWELRQATKDVMQLEGQRDEAEDAGEPIIKSVGDLDRAKIKRDNLFAEWMAEVNYVRQAKADLDDWIAHCDSENAEARGDTPLAPVLRSPLGSKILVEWQVNHELSYLTELVRGAQILPSVVLPRGVLEDRNSILLEIARVNDLDIAFMRLPKVERERSLDAFADMVLDATDRGGEQIEAMQRGTLLLQDMPDLEEKIREILPSAAGMQRLLASAADTLGESA